MTTRLSNCQLWIIVGAVSAAIALVLALPMLGMAVALNTVTTGWVPLRWLIGGR